MSSFDVLMNPTKLSPDKYLIHFLKSNWSEVSFSTVKYNQNRHFFMFWRRFIVNMYLTVMIVEFTSTWHSLENH